MRQVRFGRTGLDVSVAGLGTGGDSKLGLNTGQSRDSAIAVVRRAYELGVTFFDTARSYDTEDVVGEAVEAFRGSIVLSSKMNPRIKDGILLDAAAFRREVEASLAALRTDMIDIYHLHRVRLHDYDYCLGEILPELVRLRDAGKIRFLAVSESAGSDPGHTMLDRALDDDCWDAMMTTFTLFDQSARTVVLGRARAKQIGIEIMSAVRGPYSRPAELAALIEGYVAKGELSGEQLDRSDPLGAILKEAGASSAIDAGYRLASHEPGTSVVLTGTGNVEHLAANLASIDGPPLDPAGLETITRLFGNLPPLS